MLRKFLYQTGLSEKLGISGKTKERDEKKVRISSRFFAFLSFQQRATGFFILTALFFGACASKAEQDSAALKKDAAGFARLVQINNLINASNSITPEDFTTVKTIFEKYPNAPEARQVYRSALITRKDWPALEKLLTEQPFADLSDEDRQTLGQVYIKSGKYADAAETLKPLADKKPADVELQSLLGIALYYLGRLDEAAARLDGVWNQITAGKRMDEMTLRGIIYLKQNDPAKAEEILKMADAAEPGNAAVNNALMQVYVRQGKTEEAEKYRRRTIEINDKLAADEFRSMRRVEQLNELEKAWKAKNYAQVVTLVKQLLPATPDKTGKIALYQYMAEAYKALGNQTEAQNALAEAQKLQQQK